MIEKGNRDAQRVDTMISRWRNLTLITMKLRKKSWDISIFFFFCTSTFNRYHCHPKACTGPTEHHSSSCTLSLAWFSWNIKGAFLLYIYMTWARNVRRWCMILCVDLRKAFFPRIHASTTNSRRKMKNSWLLRAYVHDRETLSFTVRHQDIKHQYLQDQHYRRTAWFVQHIYAWGQYLGHEDAQARPWPSSQLGAVSASFPT